MVLFFPYAINTRTPIAHASKRLSDHVFDEVKSLLRDINRFAEAIPRETSNWNKLDMTANTAQNQCLCSSRHTNPKPDPGKQKPKAFHCPHYICPNHCPHCWQATLKTVGNCRYDVHMCWALAPRKQVSEEIQIDLTAVCWKALLQGKRTADNYKSIEVKLWQPATHLRFYKNSAEPLVAIFGLQVFMIISVSLVHGLHPNLPLQFQRTWTNDWSLKGIVYPCQPWPLPSLKPSWPL